MLPSIKTSLKKIPWYEAIANNGIQLQEVPLFNKVYYRIKIRTYMQHE